LLDPVSAIPQPASAAREAGSEAVQGAGAVEFEGEDVLGGPVDRLVRWRTGARCSPLPGSSVRRGAGSGVQGANVCIELSGAKVLVAQGPDFARAGVCGARPCAGRRVSRRSSGGHCERPRGAVHREQRVQPKAAEVTAVTAAVAVVSTVSCDRAVSTGGAVDEQDVVPRAGAAGRELCDQRFDGSRQPARDGCGARTPAGCAGTGGPGVWRRQPRTSGPTECS
jgi:hypothetical protein